MTVISTGAEQKRREIRWRANAKLRAQHRAEQHRAEVAAEAAPAPSRPALAASYVAPETLVTVPPAAAAAAATAPPPAPAVYVDRSLPFNLAAIEEDVRSGRLGELIRGGGGTGRRVLRNLVLVAWVDDQVRADFGSMTTLQGHFLWLASQAGADPQTMRELARVPVTVVRPVAQTPATSEIATICRALGIVDRDLLAEIEAGWTDPQARDDYGSARAYVGQWVLDHYAAYLAQKETSR